MCDRPEKIKLMHLILVTSVTSLQAKIVRYNDPHIHVRWFEEYKLLSKNENKQDIIKIVKNLPIKAVIIKL